MNWSPKIVAKCGKPLGTFWVIHTARHRVRYRDWCRYLLNVYSTQWKLAPVPVSEQCKHLHTILHKSFLSVSVSVSGSIKNTIWQTYYVNPDQCRIRLNHTEPYVLWAESILFKGALCPWGFHVNYWDWCHQYIIQISYQRQNRPYFTKISTESYPLPIQQTSQLNRHGYAGRILDSPIGRC